MFESALRYVQHIKTTFLGLPKAQKVLYTGGLVALIGSIALMVYLFNRADYAPLFTNLSQSDMGEVVQSLKVKKIPYQLSNGSVDVPRENLYDTRLTLAAEGIPKGAGVGFEIFDQQKLGSTDFVQKINYQRAIQGELARTINGMDEVLESRVHVVMPEESLFQEDRKPASAAVVLKLHPGRKLDPRQVRGIVHLVSSTVRGLDEDRISIMSTDGQVLFKKNQGETNGGGVAQRERQSQVEDDMRQKVQTMLEQLVGSNKVLTRVAVDLDFNQVQLAEESYDPDSSVIRSQQRSVENADGKEMAARGNPDVPINMEGKLLQNGGASPDGKGKQYNRQRETVNYEINKVSKQIIQSPGALKRVSVAVILDGPYEMKADAAGKQKLTFVGRTPAEMKSIEDVVRKAVGYSEARGDQITVSNFPFASDAPGETGFADNRWINLLRSNQKIIINVLLGILVFLFLVRPLLRRIKQFGKDAAATGTAPLALPGGEQVAAAAGAGGGMITDLPAEKKLSLRKSVIQLVQHDPNRATEIIRALLREEV